MGLTKVTHVTFDMRIGGAEQVIYNLIENTDKSKYDVSILCLDQPLGTFGVRLREKGYRITCFNRKAGFDIGLIRQIRTHTVKNGIHILHCHQYTPYVYGLFGAVLNPVRIIFTEHGRFYPDRKKIKRVLVNPILSVLTDYITAISSATRDALIDYEKFRGKRIRVIYNGIDDTKFVGRVDGRRVKQSLGIPEKAHIIGTVARLDPIKNQKMMIRALKEVRERFGEVFLIIVGDGPERKRLEAMTCELGLASHVIFTGFREDMHDYYNIMEIFLLTSFSEGTAMTLLEAMASGLPCVATDVGGNGEIVKDKVTGFIISSDDHDALAERICQLLGNANLMARMGRAGRERYKERFTVEEMVRAYESLYDGTA